jgi:hypothetical protein
MGQLYIEDMSILSNKLLPGSCLLAASYRAATEEEKFFS